MVMYRHMHFYEKNEMVVRRTGDAFDCDIKGHHLTASVDDFCAVAFHWDLMIASKLNYIHDFPGMFNCVSQVVYFHNPSYRQQVQERNNVHGVSTGAVEAVHVIPPLMQLYPEIEIMYEEAIINLLKPSNTYSFVVLGKRVYLLTPNRQIHYHQNITVLLELYLKTRG